MNKKQIYTSILGCAIAFSAASLRAEENSQPDSANNTFVCATQQDISTIYSYTPGQVNINPLMSWHPEYLASGESGPEVCQQTAAKLQASIGQKEEKYLKVYRKKGTQSNLVCLVGEENQTCASEGSETLFSVNPDYNAECVLQNKRPIDCVVMNVTRGSIYSYNEQPYQLQWWPW